MTQPKTSYTLTLPAVPPGDFTSADIRAFRDKLAGEITNLTDFLLAACALGNETFSADMDVAGMATWADEAVNEMMLYPLDLTAEQEDLHQAAERGRGIVKQGRLL